MCLGPLYSGPRSLCFWLNRLGEGPHLRISVNKSVRQRTESGVLPQKRILVFWICSRFNNVMPRQILVRIEPKHFQKRHKLKGNKKFFGQRQYNLPKFQISFSRLAKLSKVQANFLQEIKKCHEKSHRRSRRKQGMPMMKIYYQAMLSWTVVQAKKKTPTLN